MHVNGSLTLTMCIVTTVQHSSSVESCTYNYDEEMASSKS